MKSDHPLERHDLGRLEAAAKELDAHIKNRRPKPSIERRMISTAIAAVLIFGGVVGAISWFSWHTFMPPGLLGLTYLALVVVGGLMIYSDWFE
jgi:hypothetical protein